MAGCFAFLTFRLKLSFCFWVFINRTTMCVRVCTCMCTHSTVGWICGCITLGQGEVALFPNLSWAQVAASWWKQISADNILGAQAFRSVPSDGPSAFQRLRGATQLFLLNFVQKQWTPGDSTVWAAKAESKKREEDPERQWSHFSGLHFSWTLESCYFLSHGLPGRTFFF